MIKSAKINATIRGIAKVVRAAGLVIVAGLGGVILSGVSGDLAAKQSSAASPMSELQAGYNLLSKKRYNDAVRKFTSALESGKLKRNEMAKALYYRGAAYRGARQPARAISDFSSALWLKGALSQTEQKDAENQRTAAYKEAGASNSAPVAVARAGSAPAAAPQPSGPASSAAKPWQTATRSSNASVPAQSTQPTRTTVQPDPVASFFSNLFGGTPTAQQPAKSSPHMTGSVSQVSAWSSATQTTPVTASTSRDRRSKSRTAAAPPKGRYILQVGAARNKAEAAALVRKLSAKHPDILRGRQATVTPEVFGNMGTLYQVRVAPFAKAASAQPFCKGLRASGLDCLIQRR